MNKRNLTFWQMWNLSFGFFGVQIAYALQSANISRIFATLGADPHQLSFFWILPPLMGMIVQPLIGKWSDRTWCRMGRRKPYLLVGAIVAVLVMLFLPNAGSLSFSSRLLLGLNGAMWFGLFSLIFLDTSINVAMQPFKMMVGDMVNEEQKGKAYSIQSFLCNAGSFVGYLFPIFFTWIGIANTAPEGVVPDSVKWSFYIGALILILCVLYTFAKVKEMNPQEYAEFHGIDLQNQQEKKADKGLVKLLVEAPKAFWTVGLVQFFCWSAFLYMWTYTNGSIASTVWGTTDAASEGYQAAGNWVGVLFAVQAVGSMLWALLIPKFRSHRSAYIVSLVLGAIGFIILLSLSKGLGSLKTAVKDPKGMKYATLLTIFGPALGVSLSLMAVRYANAGIASTLMALTPVLIIAPDVLINKHKIKVKEILGVLVSVTGVALFFLL